MSIVDKIKTETRWTTREQLLLIYFDNNNSDSDLYDHIWSVVRHEVIMKIDDVWIKAYHEFIDEKNPLRYAYD